MPYIAIVVRGWLKPTVATSRMRISHGFVAVWAFAFLAACSHSSDKGEATTSSQTVTAATASATATSATDAAQSSTGGGTAATGGDAAQLGVPIYPGAAKKVNALVSGGELRIAQFQSADPLDKVYAFYKAQLPDGSEGRNIPGIMAMFVVNHGASGESTVQLSPTADKSGTVISITRSMKTP